MSLKLQNEQALRKHFINQVNVIEKVLVRELEILVAQLENHAKDEAVAGYIDQTANLKSSIGGVVLKNGFPVSFSGFEGTQEGVQTGNEFINSLIECLCVCV